MATSISERFHKAQKSLQEEKNKIELQQAAEEAALKEIQNTKAEAMLAAITGASEDTTANKDAITAIRQRAAARKKAVQTANAAKKAAEDASVAAVTGTSDDEAANKDAITSLKQRANQRSTTIQAAKKAQEEETANIITGNSDNESAVKDYMTNYKRYAAAQTKQKQAIAEIQGAAKTRQEAQTARYTGAENSKSITPAAKKAQSSTRSTVSPIQTGRTIASRYQSSHATPTTSELESLLLQQAHSQYQQKQAQEAQAQTERAKNGTLTNSEVTNLLKAMAAITEDTTPVTRSEAAAQKAQAKAAEEAKNTLKNLGYGTERLGAAILGAGEGVTDMIGSGFWNALAAILPAGTSAETFAKEAADRFLNNSISRDWEESIAERYQPSKAQEIATDITGSAAQMLPMIATGTGLTSALSAGTNAIQAEKAAETADLVQKILFGLQAAGNSASEAKQEGASANEALLYGLASGMLETETEAMFGGIPGLSEGQLDDILERITGGGAISKLLDIAGEGAEEAVSEIVTPYLQRAVYDKDAENASLEDVLKAAALGSATAGLLQAGIELPSSLYNRIGTQTAAENAASGQTDGQALWQLLQQAESQNTGSGRSVETEAQAQESERAKLAEEYAETLQKLLTIPGTPETSNEVSATQTEGGANSYDNGGTQTEGARDGAEAERAALREAAADQLATGRNAAAAQLAEAGGTAGANGLRDIHETTSQYASQLAQRAANASNGNGQRVAGAGAVGQAGTVAAGTAGAQGGNTGVKQSRTASSRRTRAQDLRLERVSSRELGVWQGTDSPVNMVMPESLWDAEMQEAAQTAKDVSGYDVHYVINKMQTRNGGTARGTIVGNTIYAQADDIKFSVSQIVDHELYHTMALADTRINEATRESILSRYSEAELDEVVSQYAMELMGAYGISENATDAEYNAYLELMQEEVFADAYAGMNAFGAGANRFQGAVRETAETWQDQTAQSASEKQTSAATEMTNGPGNSSTGETSPSRPEGPRHLSSLGEASELRSNDSGAEEIRGEASGALRSEELLAELPEGVQDYLREWNQTENKWDYDGPLGDLELRLDDLHAMDSQAYNTAMEYLDALGEEENSSQQAQSSSQQPRFSIDYDASNQPFVTVDEDILDGVPESEWVKTVKQNLKEKFPNGITMGNNEIRIDRNSRREMTYSNYMQRMLRNNPERYADKLRATNNADEILQTTQNWVNESLLHPRKDAIIDFARGNARIRVGENDYTAEVIVGNRGNGDLLLYDIINLKPTTITTKETGASDIVQLQKGVSDRQLAPVSESDMAIAKNSSPRTDRRTISGFEDSIAEESGTVNAEESEKPKTQPRFSLASPVEYTEDLIAVHNLSEENLEQTLELGGFPAPSIAIVNATQGHTQFGDYSVVFNRAAIDPETDSRNKVYGRDAWTPTVGGNATVEYRVDTEKLRALDKMLSELSGQVADGAFQSYSSARSIINVDATEKSAKKIAYELSGLPGVRAAYLATQGETVDAAYRKKYLWNGFEDDVVESYLESADLLALQDMTARVEAGEHLTEDETSEIRAQLLEHFDETHPGASDEKRPFLRDRRKNYAARLSDTKIEDFVLGAAEYQNTPEAERYELDRNKTANNIDEAIRWLPNGKQGLEQWTRSLIEPIIGERGVRNGVDRFTNEGNRRSFEETHEAATAENIVRAMYESGKQTGNNANSLNSILTETAPRFQSVEEMHEESDRMQNYDPAAYDADWMRMRNELETLKDEIIDGTYATDENAEADYDTVEEAFLEAARQYGADENGLWTDEIQDIFAGHGLSCDEETAERIESLLAEAKAMPTDYFEAKPERAVGFNEVAAVIAPDNIPDELFMRLSENDIDVRLYQKGNDAERLDALNSLEGVRFSNGGGSLKTELKSNLRSNFGIGSGNVKKASDVIEAALDSVTREEGQRAARDQLFDRLTELGTVEDEYSTAQTEYYKPIANRLRGSKVYVPDSVKAEFGDDWSSFRRKAFGKGLYLTGDTSAQGIDMLNAELADQWPGTFDAGETDPRAMLESMLTAAENARPEMISLQEYAIRTAERYGLRPSEALSGTRAEFDRLLDEYAAGMTRADNLSVSASGAATSPIRGGTDKRYLLEGEYTPAENTPQSASLTAPLIRGAENAEGGGSDMRRYWEKQAERQRADNLSVTPTGRDTSPIRGGEQGADLTGESEYTFDEAEEAAQRDRESYEKLSPEQRAAIDRLMQSPEYTPPTMASRMLKQERETIQNKAQSLDELKAIMRGAAEGSAIQTDRDSFIGTENLNKLGVKVAGSVTDYWDVERLTEIDKAAKDISNHVQRYAKGSGLSEKELDFASRIAAGVYDESDIPTTMNAGRVLHMAELYAQQAAANADVITARRSEIAQKLQSEAGSIITEKMIQNAKVSKTLTLNYRSPDRNMRHIFGDTEGEKVNQWVFEPLHANEAERQRWVNQMYDQVRKFTDSKGKQSALSKTERAVVQQVIEGKAAGEMAASMERGSEIQEVAKQLADGVAANQALEGRDFSEDQIRMANRLAQWEQTQRTLASGKVDTVKVENAVNAYTELFDQLYKGTNDFLIAHGYEPIGYIEGYAPHMQPDETQNKLKKAFQAMGLNTEVTNLPAEIAGLTANYKPNKNWNPYFLTRTTDTTKFDIAEAYESYIDYLSGVFYHTDDIMRLRQLTNFFRKANATEALRDNVTQAEELRSKSREEKANWLRFNGEIAADSSMSEKDVNSVLEKYIEKQYAELDKGNTRFSSLAMWLDNYTNIMARKQSAGDRGPETIFGRKALNLGNKVIASFGRAQVAGNLSSALNQMAQLPMIAAELGPKYTTEAIAGLAGIGNKEARGKAWRESSDYLTSKHGIDYLVQSNTEKLMSGLFAPASMADELLSEVAVRGRYLKELDAGKSAKEAMKIADNYGREVMGTREKGFRPTAFENKAPLMAALNVFQTEAWNTVEHITQDTFGKDFRKLVQEQGKTKAVAHTAAVSLVTLILSYLLNRGSDELYGGTPAQFDVLGYLTDFVAGGNGVTAQQQAEHWVKSFVNAASEKLGGEAIFEDGFEASNQEFDWQTALGNLWYDFSSDMPFLRNAAGLLGWGDESIPMPDMTTITDFASSLTDEDATAAERLEKAGEAVAQWIPGGRQLSKTYTGLKSALQGGKYSGYGDEKKLQYPITENRSKVTAALFGNSALDEAEEYWAEDRDALSVSQTKLYESLAMQGADQNTVYETILQYRKIGRDDDLTSLEKGVQQRAAVLSAGLEDEQALELYTGLAGSDSKTEKLTTMVDAGLTLAESFAAYDEWATLDADEDMEDTDKATQFAMWADRQGFTEEQAQTVKDTLKFWASRPVEASGYNRFTEAGLDTEAAEELTDILDELEPEDGEDEVSKDQRNLAIAESPLSDSDKDAVLETYLKDSSLTNYQEAREAGITPLEWIEYYTETKTMSADKDENGNSIQGSKKAKILAYIDSMDITSAQKDVLYRQNGYSEDAIDEAPWH